MGLSSFNRMRREKAKVAEIEAERFKRDNEARQARRQARVDAQGADDELAAKAMQEEREATKRIGKPSHGGRCRPGVDLDVDRRHQILTEVPNETFGARKSPTPSPAP